MTNPALAKIDSDIAFGSVDIHGSHDAEIIGSLKIDADVSFGQVTVEYI